MAYLHTSRRDSLATDAIQIATGALYAEAMRNPQHDAHVTAYTAFIRAYGSTEGYHLAMARKAHSEMLLMLTVEGRAFIARRNAGHAAWRASRAALPF